jgi:hypothetical protein
VCSRSLSEDKFKRITVFSKGNKKVIAGKEHAPYFTEAKPKAQKVQRLLQITYYQAMQ